MPMIPELARVGSHKLTELPFVGETRFHGGFLVRELDLAFAGLTAQVTFRCHLVT